MLKIPASFQLQLINITSTSIMLMSFLSSECSARKENYKYSKCTHLLSFDQNNTDKIMQFAIGSHPHKNKKFDCGQN